LGIWEGRQKGIVVEMNPAMPSPGVVQSACPLAPSNFHSRGTSKEKERSADMVFDIRRPSFFAGEGPPGLLRGDGWVEDREVQ
jgi:hypothetical protein